MLTVSAHTLALAQAYATAMLDILTPQALLPVLPSIIALPITAVALKNARTLAPARTHAPAILVTLFLDHHATPSISAQQTTAAAPRFAQ